MAKTAIFVEDRIFRTSSGRIVSGNRRLEGRQWEILGPRGHAATLCARLTESDPADATHTIEGVVEGLPYFQGLSLRTPFKLLGIIRKAISVARDADLIIAKCPGLIGTAGVLAGKMAGKPVAIHFVGDIDESLVGSRFNAARKAARTFATRLFQWTVQQADAVRYPTSAFLQKKFPAIDRSREFWFTDASVVALDTLPSRPAFVPGRIVAIGTQERMYKGHDYLINALAIVRKSVPEAHLVLVGQGIFRGELEILVQKLGLQDWVTFVDFLDGWGEVSAMISSAHVFAMPSLIEGLPRALLEAMSLGTACVGTDVAGMPELLPPHLLVPSRSVEPLADLIRRVLSDEDFRVSAAQECLERSKPFTAEALQPNIDAWHARLQELIAG